MDCIRDKKCEPEGKGNSHSRDSHSETANKGQALPAEDVSQSGAKNRPKESDDTHTNGGHILVYVYADVLKYVHGVKHNHINAGQLLKRKEDEQYQKWFPHVGIAERL